MSFIPVNSPSTLQTTLLQGQQPPLDGQVQAQGAGQLDGRVVQVVNQPDLELQAELLLPPDREPPRQPVLQARLVATPPDARSLARETLPSREALIDRIGAPPKRDITFLGLTLHKMSSGYKDVLAKLDSYHAALARCNAPRDQEGAGAQIEHDVDTLLDVREALAALENSLAAYEAGGRHGHKDEMRTLLAQVREERDVLGSALQQVDDGHPGVSLHDLIAFQRVHPGLSLAEVDTLVQKGWNAQDYGALWQMTLDPHGITESDVREAVRLDYDLPTVRAYHEARLPINEATRAHARIQDTLTPLGQGAINSVFKGQVELSDGTTMTGVFKAEKPGAGSFADAAKTAGIGFDRPGWATRSVATSRLEQRLGLGVIPRTEIVVHEGQLGSVMELARGVSPNTHGNFSLPLPPGVAQHLRDNPEVLRNFVLSKGFTGGEMDGDTLKVFNEKLGGVPDENGDRVEVLQGQSGRVAMDYSDPVLRRDVTKLQWLDALTGQVDRHGQNYFIERAPDGSVLGVQGIDNDIAFGNQITDANATSKVGFQALHSDGGEFDSHFKGGLLPTVVDRTTFDALMALTPEQVKADCKGLLAPDEIAATQARLAQIQAHLRGLADNGGVLETLEDWRSPEATKRLGLERDIRGPIDRLQAKLQGEGKSAFVIERDVGNLKSKMMREATTYGYLAREWVLLETGKLGTAPTPTLDVALLGNWVQWLEEMTAMQTTNPQDAPQ